MSRIRVRQSKNRLRPKLTEEEIKELRNKIRDPAYIDYVTSQLASIIFSKLGEDIFLDEPSSEDSRDTTNQETLHPSHP